MYELIEKELEVSGSYNCKIKINDFESIFLRFENDPTPEEIETTVNQHFEHLNQIKKNAILNELHSLKSRINEIENSIEQTYGITE